ncbi:MAG TPA: PEP-CTERM system TPR-repeat protein PrsT, partial [Accumulibacter sp.]|nr:PEP-CTERM system TPR-repeat protein PrsT [Accumulibacter sp.]
MCFSIFPKVHNSHILLLAFLLTACGQSPEEHLQQAKTLLEKSNHDAAIVELKNVLIDQPENGIARVLLGQSLLAKQEYQDAETEFGKARELGIPAEQWLPALAKVYVKTLQPLRTLELGVPSSGLSANALARLYSVRAEAYLALGKRAEAEREIVAAEKNDASLPAVKMTQTRLALNGGQIDQAGILIEQALRTDAKSTEILYLKAEVQQAANKFDEAIATYRQIVDIDGTQFRAHLGIAQIELYRGRIEAADQALQAAEKLAAKTLLVNFARGIIEYRRGNLEAADSAFQSTLQAAPEHIGSLLGYALTSFGAGRYEDSMQKTRKVLSSQPENKLANQLLADSLLQTGAGKEALAVLEPLLAKYPDDAKLMASIGQAYLQTKDYNWAMRYFDRATELAPNDAAIRTIRAGGHLFGGNSVQALADFEQAATMSNKLGQADLLLVKMHLQRQEFDQALLSIDQMEKKLPNNPLT